MHVLALLVWNGGGGNNVILPLEIVLNIDMVKKEHVKHKKKMK